MDEANSSDGKLPDFPGGSEDGLVVMSIRTRLREYFSTSQTDGPLLPRTTREYFAGTAWAVILIVLAYVVGDLIAGMVVGTAAGAVGAALGYVLGVARSRHASLERTGGRTSMR